ncbi:MAG: thioredoxin fold domain-containing protein [Gammaproteobacteria bacterium]|nr:thioredoxin fold domain-containing protein [Gammaproteobacteria bacterium]
MLYYPDPRGEQQGVIVRNRIILMWALAVLAGSVLAGEAEDIANIKQRLHQLVPGEPSSIQPAAIPGFYEVMYGTELLYLSADARYGIQGELVDLETGVNLAETARANVRKELIEAVHESQMLVYSPSDPRHTVTVFTDIDCGYCRKMHAEMGELHDHGIAVRYLMFPRSGVDTLSYDKAVDVWCSEDPLTSLTRAKAGEEVVSADCEHPVESQYHLGRKVGVTGTPAIVTEDGRMLRGYQPPKELAATLDSLSERNAAP